MPVHLFDRSTLVATPWKNGGGVTREIACRFAGADQARDATAPGDTGGSNSSGSSSGDPFDWRISIAHIASDGPFSAFDGIDRVITLLEGGGVRLRSNDGTIDHRLEQPLVPFAFPGEAPIQGTLLAGDCHDFNVMTRRDRYRASVRIVRQREQLPDSPDGLLMAVHGEWRASSSRGDSNTLAPNTGLWWDDLREPWQVERLSGAPDAALLVVNIQHR